MLDLLPAVLLVVPVYWLLVPVRHRRVFLALAGLTGLAVHDARLLALVIGVAGLLTVATHLLSMQAGALRRAIPALGVVLLAGLFVWSKRTGGTSALASQHGVALLGTSYLVLKAASVLIDAARGGATSTRFAELVGHLGFFPTYSAGPIETLEHYRTEPFLYDRALVLGGLERILFGLVKALLVAHYLGVWAAPIVAAPDAHSRVLCLLALQAAAVRFYLDFAGYSDIAIGIGALFGYRVEENFDRPLVRRNLTLLWQHWHMTLTRWLRSYLFVPVSRTLLRRRLPGGDHSAVAVAQVVTMVACGLWHGLTWGFVVWGIYQALGLVWTGMIARGIGAHLPGSLVRWWRTSAIAHGLAVGLTFSTFSLSMIFVLTDLPRAVHYLTRLAG